MGSLYGEDVIKVAASYEGYHEGANNWNIFAQRLDNCDYYAPQKKQNIQWCGSFVNACMLEASQPEDREDDSKKYDAQYFQYQPDWWNCSAGVREMADYYKNADAFYGEPQIGDAIFFNSVDDNGRVVATFQHVGLVIDLGDEYITTMEGNASDMVQRKYYTYSQIGSKIAGFGRPRYDGFKNPANIDHKPEPDPDPDETVSVELKTLSRGSTGGQVNTIKALLNEFGFGELPLDGDFDWDTEQAVNSYKEKYGLAVDGIVDEEMWNLILK